MLELKHLKTMLALKQAGSLASAADVLHMTQSALSHQLKELEGRFEQRMFERKSKPLRFTPAGERVLKLAEQVMPLVVRTESQLKQLQQGDGGRLNMAIECHSCFQWLLPALEQYRQIWPSVEVDFSSGFHFDAIEALIAGELDLVITADPENHADIEYFALFRYQNLMLMSPDHALAQQDTVNANDLADQHLITYPVDPHKLSVYRDLMIPAGVVPKNVRQAELTLMIVQLVLSGRGIAALPNWVIAEYIEKASLSAIPFSPPLWSTLYAAVPKQKAHQAYLTGFVDIAKSSCFSRLSDIMAVAGGHRI
ncbi:LysR family transcriptional regulator [Echinimonas agarilytica]|uniref:HTH-type transcriptional regulator MetR n=1 Tax=Echinimonas agarilytica TaxID=1215918 RepID=A0AA41W793_9GAMM|nr:LysR family transcriptional regulator [Echinimonas agarilytica]MCM2680502.1 LysR family transcriptional regulator [Echinimonas agarilytica]